MQKIVFTGNLVRDVETKPTQNEKSMAKFSVAVKRPHSKDTTDFFDVVAWNGLSDICGKYLSKGKKVAVEGYMTTRTYEKDGQTRKVYEVYAEDVEFLSNNTQGKEENPDETPF